MIVCCASLFLEIPCLVIATNELMQSKHKMKKGCKLYEINEMYCSYSKIKGFI